MNPMIAALQNRRSEGPAAPPVALPEGGPEAAGPGDIMVQKLAGLEAKLDQILQLLGATQKEEAPADEIAPEASPNDDGN